MAGSRGRGIFGRDKNLVQAGQKAVDAAISGLGLTLNPIANTTATAEAAFNKSQMSAEQAMAFEASQAAQQMAFQREMLQNQMRFNSAEAETNRAWQREMRQTAYQDTVKDMVKAGINPILAAQLGATGLSGGSTASAGLASGAMASGHTAQMQQQTVPDIIRNIGYAITTAKEAAKGLEGYTKELANEKLDRYAKQAIGSVKG
jgi:hypothetical protein